MNKIYLFLSCCTMALGLLACYRRPNSNPEKSKDDASGLVTNTGLQIDDYVVEVFEDSKGRLWFGTLSKGAACYDGKSLFYLSESEGMAGNSVVSIVEDKHGVLWFGTHSGLSRYDGITITNFKNNLNPRHDRISNLLIDRAGNFWVGTWDGVCRFDGIQFKDFPLPLPKLELLPYQDPNIVRRITEIMEDNQGNIWFARDGYGACKYDGRTFAHFTKKEGLASNNVQVMAADKQGNIWFGSRIGENDHPDAGKRLGDGGLSRYDGKQMHQFPSIEGLSKNEVYAIQTDKAGNVWIGANGLGVYRYDGRNFKAYKGTNRMDLTGKIGVQAILEDHKGRLWLGLSGGLFRLLDVSIVNVTQQGPWQ